MEKSFPGGREMFRQALIEQGFPKEALEVTMASITESTFKNYESAWKKWWNFCNEKAVRLFDPTASEVLCFLSEQFDAGLASNTINVTRSAISIIIKSNIAEDHRVKRYFQGLRKINPSKPKYNYTWDPKIILDFYSEKPLNTELNFLSKKLITLLALVTGHRMQTFSLIEINNIKISKEKIEIFVSRQIKTSKDGSMQPLLVLPFFHENLKICPAFTLQRYLESTKLYRHSIKFLFISLNKPYKAVSSQTLSRWVKEIFTECGVDSAFTAHSARHASSSAAKRSGVDLDLIRKTCGWTIKSKTFARFYDREIVSDNCDYGLAILNR